MAQATHLGRRTALLVGINDYAACRPLSGCANDVAVMRKIFETIFGFQCRVLLNADATRANVLLALEDCIASTGPSDVFIFYFAGHGSQKRRPRKVGGYNETIVAYDGSRQQHITDDEIHERLKLARSLNIGLIFDSCHSGDVTRDPSRAPREIEGIRGIPRVEADDAELPDLAPDYVGDLRAGPEEQTVDPSDDGSPRAGAGWLPLGNYVVLSSCRDRQECGEETRKSELTDNVPRRHGILTYCVASVLSRMSRERPADELGSLTWRDLYREVLVEQRNVFGTILRRRAWPQEPQLEGLTEWQLFGTLFLPVVHQAEVNSNVVGEYIIEVGKLHGVSTSSSWSLFDPRCKTSTLSAALAVSPSANPEFGTRVRWPDIPQVLHKARLSATCRANFFDRPVWFIVNLDDGATGEARRIFDDVYLQLNQSPNLAFLDTQTQPAEYTISVTNDALKLKVSTSVSEIPQYTVPLAEQSLFLANVEKLAFAQGLLRNRIIPSSNWCTIVDRFDCRLYEWKGPDEYYPELLDLASDTFQPICIAPGDTLAFEFTNKYISDVYLTLLSIDTRSCIQIHYPPLGGHTVAVHRRGGKIDRHRLTYSKTEDYIASSDGTYIEWLRIIVTNSPVDFAFLEQEGIASYRKIEETTDDGPGDGSSRPGLEVDRGSTTFKYLQRDVPIRIIKTDTQPQMEQN